LIISRQLTQELSFPHRLSKLLISRASVWVQCFALTNTVNPKKGFFCSEPGLKIFAIKKPLSSPSLLQSFGSFMSGSVLGSREKV
jgi:hypothetical protein